MNYSIKKATIEDGQLLLEMIESDQSKGLIEMLYTRRPNPYLSYNVEGQNVNILCLKNLRQIHAQIVTLTRQVFINGKNQRIGYVTGLRKRKETLLRLNWLKLFSDQIKLVNEDIGLYYFTVLEDNIKAIALFQKGRPYLPSVREIGDYSLYFIKTGLRVKHNHHLNFRRATKLDQENIIHFLNHEGKKYNLFPYINHLEQEFQHLAITDFFILEENNEMVCVGALWNQQDYKQYVIKKYNGYLKPISKIPTLPKLLGLFKLPRENEIANFATLTLFLSKDNQSSYYDYLLKQISHVNKSRYNFIVASRVNNDPISRVFQEIKHIRYQSKVFLGYYSENQLLDDVLSNKRPLYIECGLL